jgi:hypothetical protein
VDSFDHRAGSEDKEGWHASVVLATKYMVGMRTYVLMPYCCVLACWESTSTFVKATCWGHECLLERAS